MANKKWLGCDEDCFNCKYPDCYRPQNLCKTWDYDVGIGMRGKNRGKKRKNDMYDWDSTESLLHKFLVRRVRNKV